MKPRLILLQLLAILAVVGCGEDLTPDDQVEINVYFEHPNGNEVFLGRVTGTSACFEMISEFAESQGYESLDPWRERCCTIEKGSDCYRPIQRARLIKIDVKPGMLDE